MRTQATRFIRPALVVLGLLSPPGEAASQEVPPDREMAPGREVAVSVHGGIGLTTGGLAGVAGSDFAGQLWWAGARYLKAQSGGGSLLETHVEHVALLVGRSFAVNGRSRWGIGVSNSKEREIPYTPCGGCAFGDRRRGEERVTADGWGLALSLETQTGPWLGVSALGTGISAFISEEVMTLGVFGSIVVGWLR